MRLYPIMSYTDMEKDLLRRNRSKANLGVLAIYLGAAVAITLIMGWGFGWPQTGTVDTVHGDDKMPGKTYSMP
jgi:amino acid transporter